MVMFNTMVYHGVLGTAITLANHHQLAGECWGTSYFCHVELLIYCLLQLHIAQLQALPVHC